MIHECVSLLPANITSQLCKIPYDLRGFFYFSENTIILPLDNLRVKRIRPDGVLRGNLIMQEVVNGSRLIKRDAISVVENSDGTYLIEDGNSTFVNACFSNWPSIAAEIIDMKKHESQQ
jgi:hypothetical protein